MDGLHQLFWHHDKFPRHHLERLEIGGLGGQTWFSPPVFIVQWYATEKRKQVVVPLLFWWLSLLGFAPLFDLRHFFMRRIPFLSWPMR